MKEHSRKSFPVLYGIWLLLCAAGCVWISLYGKKISSLYTGKLCGVCACALMVFLAAASFAAGDIGLTGLADPDAAERMSPRRSRKTAAVVGAVFLAGTAAETAYALYGLRRGYADLMGDALAAAGIYTAASLAARKILVRMTDGDGGPSEN